MKYKYLLFDMDDTLFDFKETAKESFKMVMQMNGIDFSEELYDAYRKINHQLWYDYETGKIEKEMIFRSRFTETMKLYQFEAAGILMESQFRECLGNGAHLLDGAREVVETLADKYRLYVVTNGVEATQRKRLGDSGLRPYFLDVFISEAIGAAKPSKEFFDYVKEHIEGFDSKESLIIGDSLSSDIAGGRQAGMDTCWFPDEDAGDHENEYTYRIHSIRELLKILGE